MNLLLNNGVNTTGGAAPLQISLERQLPPSSPCKPPIKSDSLVMKTQNVLQFFSFE